MTRATIYKNDRSFRVTVELDSADRPVVFIEYSVEEGDDALGSAIYPTTEIETFASEVLGYRVAAGDCFYWGEGRPGRVEEGWRLTRA